MHIVEWFQNLLFSTNYSMKHQTLVCNALKGQTLLFGQEMEPNQTLPPRVRADVEITAIKENFFII